MSAQPEGYDADPQDDVAPLTVTRPGPLHAVVEDGLEAVEAGPELLRTGFADVPQPVVAIAAVVDGVGDVLLASSFSVGVSHDPPLVMFAVQEHSTTWPALERAPRLGVSLLGEAQLENGRDLGMRPRGTRLDGVATTRTASDALLLDGAPLRMECSVEAQHPAGDHRVVLLRVHRMAVDPSVKPLVYRNSTLEVLG